MLLILRARKCVASLIRGRIVLSLTVTAGTNDSFSGGSSIGSSAGSKTDSGVSANVVELSTTRNLSEL